jgi:limonene-1,2-epoxide hydrolase
MRLVLAVSTILVAACGTKDTPEAKPATDSAFAGVQARGGAVMGVDQYTSAHVFEDLPDGGRIVLDRGDTTDMAGIATIRGHMRAIAGDFRDGNFTKPFAVHAMDVPGTTVMTERRAKISYEAVDRPYGAEVRIRTGDPEAVSAIHEFLAFQRSDHRAAGHEGMDHSAPTATPPSPRP